MPALSPHKVRDLQTRAPQFHSLTSLAAAVGVHPSTAAKYVDVSMLAGGANPQTAPASRFPGEPVIYTTDEVATLTSENPEHADLATVLDAFQRTEDLNAAELRAACAGCDDCEAANASGYEGNGYTIVTPAEAEADENGWRSEHKAISACDQTLGENQIGAGFSSRFVKDNEDGTFQVVTVTAGVITREEWDGDEKPFDVEVQTEDLRCSDPSDPGGSELDSDVERDWPSFVSFATVAEAENYARRSAFDDYNRPD